ncbi:MAG: flagellar basal body P-ring formation chaperone FlgA [Bryobacteraceae bacterium]
MMIPFLLFSLAVQTPSCRMVRADHIYARDLAAADPLFGALPPDLPIGFAPAPGHTRVMPAAELRHIAMANGVTPPERIEPLCFAWPMAPVPDDKLLAAMRSALAKRDPRIEVLDRGRVPAPPGKIVFPVAGLSTPSSAPVVWRGYVVYAPGRRFPLWARVLVRVHENRVMANQALQPGVRIRAAQLRLEPYDGPPTRGAPFTDVADAAGMIPRFPIAAGTMLTERLLKPPDEVERGDTVAVLVRLPAARIEAAGIAEQSGARGATILVRNQESGKKFQAVVQDRDQVLVIPRAPAGLVGESGKP